jgi:hypothetical protein
MVYQMDRGNAAGKIVPGALFVAAVARNRGLPVATVSGTEAATFLGAEGVALGPADAVEALPALFADLEICCRHEGFADGWREFGCAPG